MATIALVVSNKTSASSTTVNAFFQRLGHTPTLFNMNEVTASNLTAFDLIVGAINFTDAAGYATCKDFLKTYHAAGKPMIFGFQSISTGTLIQDSFPIALGIMNEHTEAANSGPTVYIFAAHPVLAAAGITVPSSLAVYTSSTYMESATDAGVIVGTPIMAKSNSDTRRVGTLVEKGQTLVGGETSKAKMAWFGWLYGSNAIPAAVDPFMQAVINWALAPGAVVLGSVKDQAGNPLQRTVRAYNRATGQLVGVTTSRADGSFDLPTPYPDTVHFVVAFDELSGDKNAIVKDRIIPYSV
ncbi:structural protein [Xanthomonas phage Elanor]|uniref:Structural protein n=1 Tax=Xanthomonas phage Elanor TaxID=2939127 RepID=A0A9E7E1I5_9CAUD|nr:structural protein [Xanthomonas phage Elanor]URA07013.1 structural protein [Xanthomonas phage Elanor]